MKIVYDKEMMGLMRIFQNITHTDLKDCFEDKNSLLTFIVLENQIGKAIGKKAIKVKMLEKALNRKVKIAEYSEDVLQFVKNVIFPLRIENISQEGDIITLESSDTKTKSLLIGRNALNLRNLESVVKRYFKIDEIKVV